MTIKLGVVGIVATVMLLTGCEHAENYRWRSDSHVVIPAPASPPKGTEFTWLGPSVSVYSYATPSSVTPSTPPLSIQSLSDRAQAELLDYLAKSGGDSSKLTAALAKPFGSNDSGGCRNSR